MAYEPKTWGCGDTITAEDLNHIENGIADAGGALIVHFKNSEDSASPFVDYTCDTEITTIQDALDNGTPVIGIIQAWMGGEKNADIVTPVSFEIGSYVARVDLFNASLSKLGRSGWSDLYTWQMQANS